MRGYGFLFCSEFFFRTTRELEYFFFCRAEREFLFSPEFNIRLYDKNAKPDYFINDLPDCVDSDAYLFAEVFYAGLFSLSHIWRW
jgi:hypothetical protein